MNRIITTILVALLLFTTAASATSEIVSRETTWSEYPILNILGIGDSIETVTYSDGYQENIYHRSKLAPGEIVGISPSVYYNVGAPEVSIPIDLKGMSCSLGSYSYHTLQVYYQASNHANDEKITDKQLPGGIICGSIVNYDLTVDKSAFGTKINTPGTYTLEIREVSWNNKGIQILQIGQVNLIVLPLEQFADFKATTLIPSKFTISTSETISVSATIKNSGTKSATLPVDLLINNVKSDSQSVTLNSGESKSITFNNVRFLIAGNHKVSVLGQSQTIVVSGSAQPTPAPTSPPPTGSGTISISSTPSGATVRISSDEIGKTPVSVSRASGNYILATSMAGYKTDYYGVTVTNGQTVSHNVNLALIPTTTEPAQTTPATTTPVTTTPVTTTPVTTTPAMTTPAITETSPSPTSGGGGEVVYDCIEGQVLTDNGCKYLSTPTGYGGAGNEPSFIDDPIVVWGAAGALILALVFITTMPAKKGKKNWRSK